MCGAGAGDSRHAENNVWGEWWCGPVPVWRGPLAVVRGKLPSVSGLSIDPSAAPPRPELRHQQCDAGRCVGHHTPVTIISQHNTHPALMGFDSVSSNVLIHIAEIFGHHDPSCLQECLV